MLISSGCTTIQKEQWHLRSVYWLPSFSFSNMSISLSFSMRICEIRKTRLSSSLHSPCLRFFASFHLKSIHIPASSRANKLSVKSRWRLSIFSFPAFFISIALCLRSYAARLVGSKRTSFASLMSLNNSANRYSLPPKWILALAFPLFLSGWYFFARRRYALLIVRSSLSTSISRRA